MLDEYYDLMRTVSYHLETPIIKKGLFANKGILLPNHDFHIEYWRQNIRSRDTFKMTPIVFDVTLSLAPTGDYSQCVIWNHPDNKFTGLSGNPVLFRYKNQTILLFKK